MFDNLTTEDWKSEEANNFVFALIAFTTTLILALLALIFVFTFAAFATILAFAALALIITLIFVFTFALAVEPVSKITIWYYVFRFPGAWYHHRKNRSD